MRELGDVLRVVDALDGSRSSAVLATLVRARGSTYRRPGARMVLVDAIPTVGAISGGCLERDVARRAFYLTERGPAVVTYDSRPNGDRTEPDEEASDDDLRAGFGLGCEGAVDVLLERLGPGAASDALAFAGECRRQKQRGVIVTVFAGENVGARLVMDHAGRTTSLGWAKADAALLDHLSTRARQALATGTSVVLDAAAEASARIEAFVEVVEPAVPLVVCGAGYDAAPLVQLGVALGWDVTVVASRSAELGRVRVPDVTQVVAPSPVGLAGRLGLDARTAVVIMSHNYPRDLATLAEILPSAAGYVGVLGPRKRTERMLAELAEAGHPASDRERARLHGPIGLDIGAEGPEEVALAIAAEILAVASGREGTQLKNRIGPIHP